MANFPIKNFEKQGVVEQAKAMQETAQDDLKAAGLGVMQIPKAIKALGKNVGTLKTGLGKLTNLGPVGKEAAENFKDMCMKAEDNFALADKMAEEAKAKKVIACRLYS